MHKKVLGGGQNYTGYRIALHLEPYEKLAQEHKDTLDTFNNTISLRKCKFVKLDPVSKNF